jgi:hypothetical protein
MIEEYHGDGGRPARICPTNFSLSLLNDKLKLVEHFRACGALRAGRLRSQSGSMCALNQFCGPRIR